jgi:hypothetical protein
MKKTFIKLFVAVAVLWAWQTHATLYTIGGTANLEGGWNLHIDGAQKGGGNALVGGIILTPSFGNSIISVCADVGGTVSIGSSYNYYQKTFQGQDGLNPNWGYGNTGTSTLKNSANASAAIQNAAHIFSLHQSVMTTGTLSQKAALQLAVWEALYDSGNPNGFNFSGGRFTASNGADTAAVTTALSWLNNDLGQGNQPTYTGFLLQPSKDGGVTPQMGVQEMLFNITPVPESTTIIAGALLLIPFGINTIRIIRKNRRP